MRRGKADSAGSIRRTIALDEPRQSAARAIAMRDNQQ
jgi:hypothetical protein